MANSSPHGNTVAFLRSGIAQYKAAIVFLPGLRDPATGKDLDSRALVRGTASGGCSIWCSPAERAEVRTRALALAGGNVALIGTTTLIDTPASYDTLLTALSDFGTQSQHPELANIPILFVGHSQGRMHCVRVQPRAWRPGRGVHDHEGRLPQPCPRSGSRQRPGLFPDRSPG